MAADQTAIDRILARQQQGAAGPAGIPHAPSDQAEFGQADAPFATGTGPDTAAINRVMSRPREEVTMRDRAMLSLIKEDPELQLKYLERQGFEAKLDKGVAKIKGRSGFVNFDPEGLDLGDFVDIVPEVVEGVVGAVATTGKVLGALGAPLTGGGSLAAASALGGAATAATETAKQGLAASLGLREGLDAGRIARQGVIGAAVPPAVTGIAKAIGTGGKALSKKFFGGTDEALKKDPEAIKAGFKLIGGKPTPGQLSDSPALQATEEVLAKNQLSLGGAVLRKQRRVNEAEAVRAAEELVAVKSARASDTHEVGKQFEQKIMGSINKRLAKAEELYGELDTSLKNVPAQTGALTRGMEKLESDLRFSDDGLAVLAKFRNKLDQIETAEDLKLFRTSINSEIPPTASKNMRIAADRIYALATKARTNSYDAAIRELKKIGEPGSEAGLKALKSKLSEADGIYAETARKIEKAILRPGKKLKTGVRRGAEEAIEAVPAEKRARQFLTGQNPDVAQAIKDLSPEAFEELSDSLSARIAEKATRTGKGSGSKLNPQSVAKQILDLNPEFALRKWGPDGIERAKALALIYREMPPELNPSGTASFKGMMNVMASNLTSVPVATVRAFLRAPKSEAAKTALFTALSEGLESGEDKNAPD